ncbi:hypothetical protein BHM03_00036775 [Ensete ventricosum]|nr:hypothetical protein BHM03_00036775 [Ensete ventricosum]
MVDMGSTEKKKGRGKVLSWEVRYKVAMGIAHAVEYLHFGTDRCIIHRDIKPSNILLTSNKAPKLCDFGLATWTHGPSVPFLCKSVKGTFGYLAPEYFQHGKLSDKTDVYAFGVVLLELITGQKAIDRNRPQGEENLVLWGEDACSDWSVLMANGCLTGYGAKSDMSSHLALAMLGDRWLQHRPIAMASILGSPPAFLARPPPTKPQLSCSQTPRPQQPIRPQPEPSAQPSSPPKKPHPRPKVAAESTDWIASSLTRRFGLGAGLAWVGFLAVGVVSEQIKTRLEVSRERANTKYTELRVGGGASPRPGDLVVIDLQGRAEEGSSDAFVDTFGEGKRPLALVMGSRPYTKGMCEGVEYVLRSMKAGGKRRVVVPPALGFGDDGADLGAGLRIPASATLEYIVQVDKVSIAPS